VERGSSKPLVPVHSAGSLNILKVAHLLSSLFAFMRDVRALWPKPPPKSNEKQTHDRSSADH
jgi:hypothetical protein